MILGRIADQPVEPLSRGPSAPLPERLPELDLSFGVDPRVCDRAVHLLDKLRRSEMLPFGSESRVASVTGGSYGILEISDLKNPFKGPWVMSQMRAWGGTTVAGSAAGAVPGNLALRIIDNDRAKPLSKNAILLAGLFALDSNTWELDRPHVFAPAASIFARLENPGGAGTGAYVSFLGEVVLGNAITAAEVREAIGLGIYPTAAWRSGVWTNSVLLPLLLSDEPVCATAEGEALRWELRARVGMLRWKLATAQVRPQALMGYVQNVPASSSRPFQIATLRNDSGFPVLLNKVVFGTVSADAASAVGSVFSNISINMFLTGGAQEDRYMTWRRILLPTLVDRSTNTWMFERPVLVRPDEAFKVEALEGGINATTDVYVGFQGFVAEGLSVDEARECASLGLFSAWRRSGD